MGFRLLPSHQLVKLLFILSTYLTTLSLHPIQVLNVTYMEQKWTKLQYRHLQAQFSISSHIVQLKNCFNISWVENLLNLLLKYSVYFSSLGQPGQAQGSGIATDPEELVQNLLVKMYSNSSAPLLFCFFHLSEKLMCHKVYSLLWIWAWLWAARFIQHCCVCQQ